MPKKTDSAVSAGLGQSEPRVQHHSAVKIKKNNLMIYYLNRRAFCFKVHASVK